jgi:hypothetical protein
MRDFGDPEFDAKEVLDNFIKFVKTARTIAPIEVIEFRFGEVIFFVIAEADIPENNEITMNNVNKIHSPPTLSETDALKLTESLIYIWKESGMVKEITEPGELNFLRAFKITKPGAKIIRPRKQHKKRRIKSSFGGTWWVSGIITRWRSP